MHALATGEEDKQQGRLLLAAFWKMHALATREEDNSTK